MNSHDATFLEIVVAACQRGNQLGRSQTPGLGGQVGHHLGVTGDVEGHDGRSHIVCHLLPLALAGDDDRVRPEDVVDPLGQLAAAVALDSDPPGAAGNGLLQRRCTGRDLGRRLHIQTDGQARIEPGDERTDVEGIAERSVTSTSRYSPSDSWPVDSASPKLSLG